MKLTTRFANYSDFLEIKVDEIETSVYKNGDERNEMMLNLIEVLEDLSKLRNESLFEYLEKHFDIKIEQLNPSKIEL